MLIGFHIWRGRIVGDLINRILRYLIYIKIYQKLVLKISRLSDNKTVSTNIKNGAAK